jgi:hypothetical protein
MGFATPYKTLAGYSFDYDCNGKEEEQETVPKVSTCGVPPGCAMRSGYQPDPSPPKGITNPYCGSTNYVNCLPAGTTCSEQRSSDPAIRCH